MNAKHTATVGKIHTQVVFLMSQNPDTNMWEPMAYFPDLNWDYEGKSKQCYTHTEQHGPCCEAFALIDCRVPHKREMASVGRLKEELETLAEPYVLTVLDSVEWMNSKGKRKVEIEQAVTSLVSNTSNEELMEGIA